MGKPNRPYKALDMVSLVNLTGARCSLKAVKGKANFNSILSQQVQTHSTALFNAAKCPSDTNRERAEICGEQPVKPVSCLIVYTYDALIPLKPYSGLDVARPCLITGPFRRTCKLITKKYAYLLTVTIYSGLTTAT